MTAPRRIQRRRTKGWRTPPNTVIVTRPSRFGNPSRLSVAEEMGYIEPREAVVEFFRLWLAGDRFMWQAEEADSRREQILAGLSSLRGKNLACYCPEGEQCHADVLLARVNVPEVELTEWIATVRARVDRSRAYHHLPPIASATSEAEQAAARERSNAVLRAGDRRRRRQEREHNSPWLGRR